MTLKKIDSEPEDIKNPYSEESQTTDSEVNYLQDNIVDWPNDSDQSNLSNTNTFVSSHDIFTTIETQNTDIRILEAQVFKSIYHKCCMDVL